MEELNTTQDAPTTTEETAPEEVQLYLGKIIDPETGEELGEITEETQMDADFAEDAVKRIAWAEAKAKGAELTLATAIASSTAAFQPEVNRYKNLAKYLRFVFEPHLRRFAEKNLPKKNLPKGSKTVKTAYGALSFRSKKGAVKIADEEALAYLLREKMLGDRVSYSELRLDVSKLTLSECETVMLKIAALEPVERIVRSSSYQFDIEDLPPAILAEAVAKGALSQTKDEETFNVKV